METKGNQKLTNLFLYLSETSAGRTDTQSCCWWGRGVFQKGGVCFFGKLNHYLGAQSPNSVRPNLYPKINFCECNIHLLHVPFFQFSPRYCISDSLCATSSGKDPEVICASSEYKELKWIAGEFYWLESVQSYNEDEWDYLTELRKFVEGGMTDQSFINGVSGIVSRGCHNPPACGSGELDGDSTIARADAFKKVLKVLL